MCKNSITMYHLYYLFFLVQLAAFDFFLPKKKMQNVFCQLHIRKIAFPSKLNEYNLDPIPSNVKEIMFYLIQMPKSIQ